VVLAARSDGRSAKPTPNIPGNIEKTNQSRKVLKMQLIKSTIKTAVLATIAIALYAPIAQSAPATFAPWKARLLKNTAPSFGNVHKDAKAYQEYAKMTDAQMLERFNRIKGICAAVRKDAAEPEIKRDRNGVRVTFEGAFLDEIYDEAFADTGSQPKAIRRLDMARHEAFAAAGTICK
jgi:hypothetical protein